MKAPKIRIDEEDFAIEQQDNGRSTVVLNYKAPSGKTATVILREDKTYDEFVYDEEGGLISYNNKVMNDD